MLLCYALTQYDYYTLLLMLNQIGHKFYKTTGKLISISVFDIYKSWSPSNNLRWNSLLKEKKS